LLFFIKLLALFIRDLSRLPGFLVRVTNRPSANSVAELPCLSGDRGASPRFDHVNIDHNSDWLRCNWPRCDWPR